jgi:antitoxin FitA
VTGQAISRSGPRPNPVGSPATVQPTSLYRVGTPRNGPRGRSPSASRRPYGSGLFGIKFLIDRTGRGAPRYSPPPTAARGVIAFQQQQLHNDAMSTSITVRDVPDQTRDELASRAALSGRSLQEYLRAKLIELARQPDAEVLIARVRARKAASASILPRDRILAYRDEDRR